MNGHEIPIVVGAVVVANVAAISITGGDIANIIIASGTLAASLGVALPLIVKALRKEVKALDEKIAVVSDDVKGIASQVNGINSRLAEKVDAAIRQVHVGEVALVQKSGELDEAKGNPLGTDALKPPVSQIVQKPPEGTKP